MSHATPDGEAGKRRLFVVVSSDRGLCGGIHSSVSKATRRALGQAKAIPDEKLPAADPDSPVMVIGDKSKAQISRQFSKNLVLTFNQIGRDIPTFADAAGVADLITKSGATYDEINIVYNKFVSALSYEPAMFKVMNETQLKESREWFMLLSLCFDFFEIDFTCSWIQGV